MLQETINRYNKLFGPDAFVPGYCGKCPGARRMGDGKAVCGVDAETPYFRELPRQDGNCTPPDWCPIRHISRRETTGGSDE